MFATGDRVVYPLHGGAIIKEIERREQDGAIVEYFISYFSNKISLILLIFSSTVDTSPIVFIKSCNTLGLIIF